MTWESSPVPAVPEIVLVFTPSRPNTTVHDWISFNISGVMNEGD